MKPGIVTDPTQAVIDQIGRIAQLGFEFAEIALQPPAATDADLEPNALRSAAELAGIDILLQASPHLPIGNRHAGVESVARDELKRAVEIARRADAKLLSIEYVDLSNFYGVDEQIDYYAALFDELCSLAGDQVRLALRNSARNRREVFMFTEIFRRSLRVRLALDIGHANIGDGPNSTADFLNQSILNGRLSHVYVSENDGRGDLKLPLGSLRDGIDWPRVLDLLRKSGFDDAVTLDIASQDETYLTHSRDLLRAWWEAAG